MTPASHVRDLLRYVIDSIWEAGGSATRTRLQKLLYLLDLGHAETHSGRIWTGFEWRFHHFGPYSRELQTALDSMDGVDADDREGKSARGTFHVYSGAHGARETVDLTRILDGPGRTALTNVLQRWASVDLTELLDFVYFETRPMKSAKRGERLSFESSVGDLFVRRTVRNPKLSSGVLDRLRSDLRVRASSTSSGVPINTLTRPLGVREENFLARAEGVPYPLPQGYTDLSIGGEDRG